VDCLGFGSSGRPDFYCNDAQQCIEFFVLQLEAWITKTGYDKQGPFSVMSHSMGCYIMTHYA